MAVEVLLAVLTVTLTDIKEKEKYTEVWTVVTDTLDTFLFPANKPPGDRTPEEISEDEKIDCGIIEFLKDKVLEQPTLFPHSFILSIMVILNKGSIHSHYSGQDVNRNQETASVIHMRYTSPHNPLDSHLCF